MDAQSALSFPPLPTELIRDILEFAASSSSNTCLALTSVSSPIRLWALPILYNNVVLRTSSDVKRFLQALSSEYTAQLPKLTPPVPLSQHVKQLGIFALGPLRLIQGVITLCTNLQCLACGFSFPGDTAIKLPAATIMQLPVQTREHHLLGLSCRDGVPWFLLGKDTTHLHIQISSLQVLLSLLQMHARLPVLTHLALRIPSTLLATPYSASLFFKSLQEHNECLRVILVLITDRYDLTEWDVATGIRDANVIIERASGSVVSQWEDICTDGALWVSATAEVDRRMSTRAD